MTVLLLCETLTSTAELPAQNMSSTWLVLNCRCSARCFLMLFSAGFSANCRFTQVAACTARQASMQQHQHMLVSRQRGRTAPSDWCTRVQRQTVPWKMTHGRSHMAPCRFAGPVAPTFQCADLRHERPNITNGQPVGQALPPHQRVLVDDAVYLQARPALGVSCCRFSYEQRFCGASGMHSTHSLMPAGRPIHTSL